MRLIGLTVGERRPAQRGAGHRWLVLAVLCANLAMISLDNTILNVALPRLHAPRRDGGLNAAFSDLQWINDGYIIVFAGLLLTMGGLGDRFGRARLLAAGLTLFGAGSLLSALAWTPATLIAGRCVMGLAASMIMPATLSILVNVFADERERRFAIGIWSGVSAVGSTMGPLVGGLILSHLWWGAIFLVNLPIVGMTLLATARVVPDSKNPQARGLDLVGSALSVLALVALLWAIIEAPSRGWASTNVLVSFGLALAVGAVFIVWERRFDFPMLDLTFFRDARFSAASAAIAFTFFGMYGISFLLTQYLQEIRGASPLVAGAVAVPNAVVFFATATRVATRLAERVGSRATLVGGLGALAVSFCLYAWVGSETALGAVVATMCLTGIGMGLILGPATGLIMTSLPRERAGVGSAMNDTTRQVGGALGVAVVGSILYSGSGLGGGLTLAGVHRAAIVAAVVVACALLPVLLYLPHKGAERLLRSA